MTKTNKSHPGMQLQPHELALLIPEMSQSEYEALKDDIKANGQIEPIRTYEGKILDGRHRYRACCELEIEPEIRPLEDSVDPLNFVLSKNIHRRHLNSGQLAVLAVEIEEQLAEQAKTRQRAAGGNKKALVEKMPRTPENGPKGRSRDQAARLLGTNPRYVTDAKKLIKVNPALAKKVKAGQMTLPDAMGQLTNEIGTGGKKQSRKEERKSVLPDEESHAQPLDTRDNAATDTRGEPEEIAGPAAASGAVHEQGSEGTAEATVLDESTPLAVRSAGRKSAFEDLYLALRSARYSLESNTESIREMSSDLDPQHRGRLKHLLTRIKDWAVVTLTALDKSKSATTTEEK